MPASIFATKFSAAVGTSRTKVGAYDVPASRSAIAIGMTVTNILAVPVLATVEFYSGATYVSFSKTVKLFPGEGLAPLEALGKLVIPTTGSVHVTASVAASLDVLMTILEQDA